MFGCQSRLCANLAKYVTKPEAAGQPVNLVKSCKEITKWPGGCMSLG